jgi:hypothetical protein
MLSHVANENHHWTLGSVFDFFWDSSHGRFIPRNAIPCMPRFATRAIGSLELEARSFGIQESF